MRSVVRTQPPRRRVPSVSGGKSRTEAATELVRLEYERERLSLGVEQHRHRLAATLDALQTVDRRIQWLMDRNDLVNLPGNLALPRAGKAPNRSG